jgi:hypothetical protein
MIRIGLAILKGRTGLAVLTEIGQVPKSQIAGRRIEQQNEQRSDQKISHPNGANTQELGLGGLRDGLPHWAASSQ